MAGWFTSVVNVLWPASCAGCKRSGAWWCTECASRVQVRATPIPNDSDKLAGLVAGTYFRDPLPAAIKALKYKHTRAVANDLIQYLLPPLAPITAPSSVLVPIPLHPSRLKQRGHNQSAILARLLSQKSGLTYNDALRRTRPTPTQTSLHRPERFKNVAGAFEWKPGIPKPKAVILVDDVVTTGATFVAAGEACRRAGVTEIWGLAVAYRN